MKKILILAGLLLAVALTAVACKGGDGEEPTKPRIELTDAPTLPVTEPEATEPEATEPEATEPEVTEPEATEPEVTEPEATEPEATEPEATEPEETEPEETTPPAPSSPIEIDGNFSDWEDKEITTIVSDKFIAWTGATPYGFSVDASFAADADNLYVYLNAGNGVNISKYQVCIITNNNEKTDSAQAWYGITSSGAASETALSTGKNATAKLTGAAAEIAIPIRSIYGSSYTLPFETRVLIVAQINGDINMGTFYDGKNPGDWSDRSNDGCPLALNADGTYTLTLPEPPPATPVSGISTAGDHRLYIPKWDDAAQTVEGHYVLTADSTTTFGQRFEVADSLKLTKISFKYMANDIGSGGKINGTLRIYRWTGDHSSTVSGEVLYTTSFSSVHDASVEIPVSGELSGELYYEITAESGHFFKPFLAPNDLDCNLGTSYINGSEVRTEIFGTISLAAK